MSEKDESKIDDDGVKLSKNELGQQVLDVDRYDEPYMQQYNGKYVFSRLQWRHRKVLFNIIDGLSENNAEWATIATEIAKQRGIQVRKVSEMLSEGQLNAEEQEMFEKAAAGTGIDITKMYDWAGVMLGEFIIESPVSFKTLEEIEKHDFEHIQLLYTYCVKWAMSFITTSAERRKK